MRYLIAATAVMVIVLITPMLHAAPDAGVKADITVIKAKPTSLPTSQPVADPAMPPDVPKTPGEAMTAAKDLLDMAKAKQWFGFSAGAIWLFMFLFKFGRKNLDFMKKIPKRALWIMVPILSIAAMVLSKLQADLSWGAAFAVLFSGPSVAFLNDMVKRGVMGKEPASPVSGGVA